MFSKLLIALRLKKPAPRFVPAPVLRPPRVVAGMHHAGYSPVRKTTAAPAPVPRRRDDDNAPSSSPAYEPWNSTPSWAAPVAAGAAAAVFASGRGGDFGGGGASGGWDAPSPCPAPSPSYDSGSSDSGSCSSNDSGSSSSYSSD